MAVCYGELTPETVWFAGAGLALVFLGLLNVAADAAASPRVWIICRVANLMGVAFGGPAAIAVWEPQGYVGLLLLVTLAITSFVSTGRDAGGPPGLSRWAAIGAAGIFGACALATGYMLAGCIADGHPWFQVVTWALLAPAFAVAAWLVVRRMRGAAPNSAP
jgi:hypothetical protein